MNNIESKYILILTAIFLVGCSSEGAIEYGSIPEEDGDLSLTVEEKISIYEDVENFYLGALRNTVVDKEGYIYLFDDAQGTAFVVDSTGNYVDSIFGAGRGPGEVLTFTSVTMNEDGDEIFVSDRQNMRLMLTDLDGEVLNVYNHDPSTVESPTEIVSYEDSIYLLLFSLSEGQILRQEEGVDEFFHFYDMGIGERTNSFGDRQEIIANLGYEESSVSRSFTQLYVGHVTFFSSNYMIYAPYVYSNSLLVYQRDENGNWNFHSKMDANSIERPAFVDLDIDSEEPESGKHIFRTVGGIGETLGFIHRRNVGVYNLGNNDVILSFFVEEYEIEDSFYHELHVEVFNSEFEYLGRNKLIEGEPGNIFFDIDWMDSEGNFYLTVRNGQHHVRVFQISDIVSSEESLYAGN